MAVISVNIEVQNGNAKVAPDPAKVSKRTRDQVKFHSNKKETTIVYNATTPFSDLAVGEQATLGANGRTFTAANLGLHHFDCGTIVGGQFVKWGSVGGLAGGDTDVGL